MGQERVARAKMAAVLVTAQLCEPSSELHIAEDWYRGRMLGDLLPLGDEEVNKVGSIARSIACSLTRAPSKCICPNVAESCSRSTRTCCSTTSRAHISEARRSRTRRRSVAYSRDHRPDCKQVCIALV